MNKETSTTSPKPNVNMVLADGFNFKALVYSLVKFPCVRISFRKDKWGYIATVYFDVVSPVHLCCDFGEKVSDEEVKSFVHYVNNNSALFVREAENIYGKNWYNKIKHRKGNGVR